MTNLAMALRAYQQKLDLDGKAMAKAIGIGESTYTRICQGIGPDAQNLMKVMVWLLLEVSK